VLIERRRYPATRAVTWRSNQGICDWADALYPELPATTSYNHERTGHDGVFRVAREDVPIYIEKYSPTVLRWNKCSPTLGFAGMNIGVSKGSTFDRALIFPTGPMVQYLRTGSPTGLSLQSTFMSPSLGLGIASPSLWIATTRTTHPSDEVQASVAGIN